MLSFFQGDLEQLRTCKYQCVGESPIEAVINQDPALLVSNGNQSVCPFYITSLPLPINLAYILPLNFNFNLQMVCSDNEQCFQVKADLFVKCLYGPYIFPLGLIQLILHPKCAKYGYMVCVDLEQSFKVKVKVISDPFKKPLSRLYILSHWIYLAYTSFNAVRWGKIK